MSNSTVEVFRQLALSFPEAIESGHMGQADFRVNKKIFATLDGAKNLGTLKLTPDDQLLFLEINPEVFFPANGAWGERGWTRLHLQEVDEATLRSGLEKAWKGVAPKKLITAYDQGPG